MKYLLFLILFLSAATNTMKASIDCTMSALYDTHAVEDPGVVWKRGLRQSPITQLVVNKRSGAKSYCVHGGYCYLAVINVNGRAVEALRMTNCRIQRGDSGDDDGDSITYSLEGVPATAVSNPQSERAYDLKGVRGRCNDESHTVSGPIEDNISERKRSFGCNTAAFTFMDNDNKRIRIMFFDSSHVKNGPFLGFEGTMLDDGTTLQVSKMFYLSLANELNTSDFSVCGMTFENGSPKTITCYGVAGDRFNKYLGEIDFVANPN